VLISGNDILPGLLIARFSEMTCQFRAARIGDFPHPSKTLRELQKLGPLKITTPRLTLSFWQTVSGQKWNSGEDWGVRYSAGTKTQIATEDDVSSEGFPWVKPIDRIATPQRRERAVRIALELLDRDEMLSSVIGQELFSGNPGRNEHRHQIKSWQDRATQMEVFAVTDENRGKGVTLGNRPNESCEMNTPLLSRKHLHLAFQVGFRSHPELLWTKRALFFDEFENIRLG